MYIHDYNKHLLTYSIYTTLHYKTLLTSARSLTVPPALSPSATRALCSRSGPRATSSSTLLNMPSLKGSPVYIVNTCTHINIVQILTHIHIYIRHIPVTAAVDAVPVVLVAKPDKKGSFHSLIIPSTSIKGCIRLRKPLRYIYN